MRPRLVHDASLLVSVVDDDCSIREALPDLLRELGFSAESFASGEAYLASSALGRSACLILDVAMPGMSGPQLQRELTRRHLDTPIVFITAHHDDAIGPAGPWQGAESCLFKPFSDAALLDALHAALRR